MVVYISYIYFFFFFFAQSFYIHLCLVPQGCSEIVAQFLCLSKMIIRIPGMEACLYLTRNRCLFQPLWMQWITNATQRKLIFVRWWQYLQQKVWLMRVQMLLWREIQTKSFSFHPVFMKLKHRTIITNTCIKYPIVMVCNFRNDTYNLSSVDITTTAADTGVYFPVVWCFYEFAEFYCKYGCTVYLCIISINKEK